MSTIRDTARVHPSEPVDGTRKGRGPNRRHRGPDRDPVVLGQVPDEVMTLARLLCSPGQRIIVESPTSVLVSGPNSAALRRP